MRALAGTIAIASKIVDPNERTAQSLALDGREVVVLTLELARAETLTDVAVLGEIHYGREVLRLRAGERRIVWPGGRRPVTRAARSWFAI